MHSRCLGGFPLLRNFLAGVALLVLLSASPAWAGRYASIIVDAENGKVLHASDPDLRSYPASLTKVMTLFLLFDELESGRLRLDTPLPVSAHASAQAPSKLGLRPGETIAVRDIILALVTKSANDAAVVAAEGIGGTEVDFAQMMTRKAQQLGMSRTVYRNASGLPNPGQVSTVRDQAILARALINRHAAEYRYFSTRQFVWKGQTITTHNRLMLRYPGADGIKTGYIAASGFNLIASAVRNGHRLVGVVFGGTSGTQRDNHMKDLLDRGFARVQAGESIEIAGPPPADDTSDIPGLAAGRLPPRPTPAVAKPKAPAIAPKPAPTRVAAKAPPPPPAKAKPVKRPTKAEAESWVIQVGAFKEFRPAQQAAAKAAQTLGRLIGKGAIDVDKLKGSPPVYRARLAGLSQSQARAACRRLGQAGQGCKLIGPNT